MTSNKQPSILSAIFLVSGTSIGGGMLAQPVAASLIGFFPATIMMLIAWAFMVSTALILLEVCLWMPNESHIISMAGKILGTAGQIISWIVYLFIGYFSLVAYISGGGEIFSNFFTSVAFAGIPFYIYCLIFTIVFGIVIEIGNKFLGKINILLFSGLIICYFSLIYIGMPAVNIGNFTYVNFAKAGFIIPLLLTSFSFQMIIPNLATYMQRDRKKLRIAIICGTLLSFAIYTIWNYIVLGAIVHGDNGGLAEAYAQGNPPTDVLQQSGSYWFGIFVQWFSFFALITSFIGIAWGLFEFLADGLKMTNLKGKKRFTVWCLTILPPLLIATTYPGLFISALETTGGFGDTILNGIIPISMFWVGHYYLKKASTAKFIGNKIYLTILSIFCMVTIALQLLQLF